MNVPLIDLAAAADAELAQSIDAAPRERGFLDARIVPPPCCIGPGNPARYEPVSAGEHLIEMHRRTTVAA